MQKGRTGTYREFEAHKAEVTLRNDNDKEKEKQEKNKKRVGEGKGKSAQNAQSAETTN